MIDTKIKSFVKNGIKESLPNLIIDTGRLVYPGDDLLSIWLVQK